MYVDINDIASEVMELVTIKTRSDVKADEYGLQTLSLLPEIKVGCIIVENVSKSLDVSTGSYLHKVVYDLYIPYKIAKENRLVGSEVVRMDGQSLTITTTPIMRSYASHAVYGATERKVYDDRA